MSSEIDSIFLSVGESSLIILFEWPARYELRDVEATERLSPCKELPKLSRFFCANVTSRKNGYESRHSLVIGGWKKNTNDHAVVEYLIGDEPKVVQRCHLLEAPTSVCSAVLCVGAVPPSIIVGCDDGRFRSMGRNEFYASRNSERRERNMREEEEGDETLVAWSDYLSTVAIIPEAGLVVVRRGDGMLHLQSAEDGRFM